MHYAVAAILITDCHFVSHSPLQALHVRCPGYARRRSIALHDIGSKVDKLDTRMDKLDTRMDKLDVGHRDLRSMIGDLHESSLRLELQSRYGSEFVKCLIVAHAYDLVRLALPEGLLLPGERLFPYASGGGGTDPTCLEHARAMVVANWLYVRSPGFVVVPPLTQI